jgi:hypothetical protein
MMAVPNVRAVLHGGDGDRAGGGVAVLGFGSGGGESRTACRRRQFSQSAHKGKYA